MSIPKELRYSEDHEWVKVEGDKARMGLLRLLNLNLVILCLLSYLKSEMN